MDLNRFLGFRIDDVKAVFHEENIDFEIIEVFDTKKTILGDDIRVIKIVNEGIIKIYVSYF